LFTGTAEQVRPGGCGRGGGGSVAASAARILDSTTGTPASLKQLKTVLVYKINNKKKLYFLYFFY
jgi:hypothetical protein